MKKKFTAFAMAALLALTMTACGQTDDPASKAGGSTEGGEFDAYLDSFTEEVTLDVAMMWPLDSETDAKSYALRNALDRLEKDYPNITVNYDGSVHDDYQTIMLTYAASDSLPDVFNVKGSWLKNLVGSEQIGTVDEFEALDPDWYGSMLESCMFDMEYDDHYYGIPFQLLTCSLVVYNTEIYESVGYSEFPTTWDEMIECFEKLQAKGYVPLGMGNSGQWVANSCVFGTMGYYGGGEQWYHDIMDGTGDGFLDKGMLSGVEKMQELTKYMNDNMNSLDQFEIMPPYLNEEYASYVDGSWTFGTLIATAGDDQSVVEKSAVAALPPFDGSKVSEPASSVGSGWGQGYNAQLSGAEKYAAYLLIKYTTDSEWCEDLYEKGDFGAILGDYDYSKSSPIVQKYVDFYPSVVATPLYDCHFDTAVIDAMNTNFQELLIGNITAEEWGQRCQEEYELSE